MNGLKYECLLIDTENYLHRIDVISKSYEIFYVIYSKAELDMKKVSDQNLKI